MIKYTRVRASQKRGIDYILILVRLCEVSELIAIGLHKISNVNLLSDLNLGIMTLADDLTTQLLRELSEAKTWPEQFKAKLEKGLDIGSEIKEVNDKIEALERRARKAIKELGEELGCGHPHTRMVFQGMADMLIEWQIFKQSLER